MSLADRPRDDVSDVSARRIAPPPAAAPESAAQPVTLESANAATASAAEGAPRRASAAFMRAHPAHWVALGFGSGLSPFGPGTAGTLWGWLSWLVLGLWLSPTQLGWLLAVALPVGVWATAVTARHLRSEDPGAIVIDEILAFWLVLWLLLPAGLWTQFVAFVLFRFFDAAKPGPVRWADRVLHGPGWRGALGIVLDDLVAAACTLLVMALWVRLWA